MDYSLVKEANPWWHDSHWHETDIHLTKLSKQKIQWEYAIIESFDEGIFSMRGPRQVGKTTWIKQKILYLLKKTNPKNLLFYSCDNINKDELMELIRLFLDYADNGMKYIFLDEIPFVEGWELVIKHLYDAGKLNRCFVLLSGSSSLDIKRSVERLPGRGDAGKRHFIMQPLLFSEYLKAIKFDVNIGITDIKHEGKKELAAIAELKLSQNELMKKYTGYLLTGGFLSIINEYFVTGHISDASYDVYLKWIIGDLAKYNFKERYAIQIIRRVLETYTTEMSWSALASKTDIDTHNTASKYAEALEEIFILNIIYRLEFNKKVSDYAKSKKIYFADPFILAACYKWVYNVEDNFNRYKEYIEKNIAQITEGVVLNHLVRVLIAHTKSNVFNYNEAIHYWTNKDKTKEVDFVYKDTAIEVKFQNQIRAEDYKALKEFKHSYLLTKDTFDKNTYPIAVFLCIIDRHISLNN